MTNQNGTPMYPAHSQDVLSSFVKGLSIRDGFTSGAHQLALFFKRTEEKFDAGDLLVQFFKSCQSSKHIEYVLFSFLQTSRTDIDTAVVTFHFKRLSRLLGKRRTSRYCTNAESGILQRLEETLEITDDYQLKSFSKEAGRIFKELLEGRAIDDSNRMRMAFMISSEAAALKERIEWISSNVNAYSMKAMARLLPLFVICDECVRAQRDLASNIAKKQPIGRPILTFELSMAGSFEKWLSCIGKNQNLKEFESLIRIQQEKIVPVRALVAATSITRLLTEVTSRTDPMIWIGRTLPCCTSREFTLDAGNTIYSVSHLLPLFSVRVIGKTIQGDFSHINIARLTGHDMLTLSPGDEQPDVKELIEASMHNDTILLALLDQPVVHNTHGIIDLIVRVSRSVAVLTKIASTPQLYNGEANRSVPEALLRSPCPIPLSLLRKFVNTMYVSLLDLKRMLTNPYGMRREVLFEIEQFVKVKK
jgi:hypothetical protein